MKNGFSLALIALLLAGVVGLAAGPAESARYVQVVDNETPGRFAASESWGASSYSPERYGENYRFATPKPVADAARYKVRIPATDRYRVHARWPANPGYNPRARIGVHTTSGWQWVTVDQRQNGGRWVHLGTFRMAAGDGWKIRVARRSGSEGYIIADAVRVARVTETQQTASGGQVTGKEILAEARTWLGVPYQYGGTSRQGVDCSGLTLKVYEKFGIRLPRTAHDQYHSGPGTKVAKTELRRGYLVFGYADGYGSGIQHVGIVTGDGRMIHAPAPGTVVRYDDLPNGWYNILGVKRIVPPA